MINIIKINIGPGVNHLFGNGAIFNRGSLPAELDVVMNDDLTPSMLNAIKRLESEEPRYQWKAIRTSECLGGHGFAEGCDFHSIITDYAPHESGSPPRQYFLMRERISGVYAQLITAEVQACNDLRQLQEDVKSTVSLRAQIVELSNQHITDCAQIDQLKSRLRSLGVEISWKHCVVVPGGIVRLPCGISIANVGLSTVYGVCCMPEAEMVRADFYSLITAVNAIIRLEVEVASLKEELAQLKQKQEG